MNYTPGDRIEYWLTTFDDGRSVHRGTIVSALDGALGVREDYKDWPDLVALTDVIRIVQRT